VSQLSIEAFHPEMGEQVCRLILDIQQNEFHVPITLADQPDLQSITSFYQNGEGNFWVALNEGTVVGTIGLRVFNQRQAALRKMFVHKNFRGKQWGTAQYLLNELLNSAKEHDITEIFLGTLDQMKAAHAFYRRNGFTETKQEHLPEDFPLVHADSMFFHKVI
jgi:N-acetylglutamate synthase-like GNAT family acetyltransferase